MYESPAHRAVLQHEAVQALAVRADGIYVDGTFGRGGHTSAILDALGPSGRLFAIDQDPEAACFARQRFQSDSRFCFTRARFGQLAEVVAQYKLTGYIHGILLDLGVSSPQLDNPQRGFSFAKDGPLDMRMNPAAGITASDWLASAVEDEISRIFKEFGEERYHRRIARAIVKARAVAPLVTTLQLAQIIASSIPIRERGKHPATRCFQALRIFINKELEELQAALGQSLDVLAAHGRLVVISFHSLEDRLVKRFMRNHAKGFDFPPELPIPVAQSGATLRLIGSALRPSMQEKNSNPRARSAVMRVAERLS